MPEQVKPGSEDPLWLILLVVVALALVFSVSRYLQDDFRWITALAVWLHVWPIAWVATPAGWLADLPAIGAILVRPAIAAEGLLRPAWSGEIGAGNWILGQAEAGRVMAAYYGPFLLRTALRARQNRPDLAFRKIHSLESLIETQSESWPSAGIVRHFDGLAARQDPDDMIRKELERNEPATGMAPDTGSCALFPAYPPVRPDPLEMALRPETWLRAEGLAERQPAGSHRAGGGSADLSVRLGREWEHLAIESVSEVMEGQLGLPWTGFADLRHVHRGLAAVFSLHFACREEDGRELLAALSISAERAAGKGRTLDAELAGNRQLLTAIDRVLDGPVGRGMKGVADRHAWRRTAVMGMLRAAREDRGVLSTASFVWLKKQDRCLWYALNATGNAVAQAEASAVCAHFRAERQTGLPLRTPSVFQAARSLVTGYLDLENPRLAQRRAAAEARRTVEHRLSAHAARLQGCDDDRPGLAGSPVTSR